MDHSPRPVVADMLFGLAVGETDGVFGDFGSEAVVGTKGFLHGIRVSVWIIRQRNISEYIYTLQLRQWQSEVRASSGDDSDSSYWMLRQ